MINGISSGSKHIYVTGGYSSAPIINNYSNQTMVGSVQYRNGNFEIYDGSVWQRIDAAFASVSMNKEAEMALDWAIKKRAEEMNLQELCKKHPGLEEAYEKFLVMKALVTVEEKEEVK